MDPTQLAQLQQLQQMYQGGGQGGGPGRIGGGFQPQQFQVANRPLPGGGGGQAAPAGAPPSGGGGGGGQQGGGQPDWAQTLMPLMKGMQGMMRPGQQQPGGAALGGVPGGGPAGPPIVQQQGQMGPFMNQMAPPGGINPGAMTNGIVNSWPYPR